MLKLDRETIVTGLGTVFAAFTVALVLVLGARACFSRDEFAALQPPSETPIEDASAPPPPPPAKGRCAEAVGESFLVGEAPKRDKDPDAGDDLEDLSPFAVEVSRAAVLADGFAFGALKQAEGGTVAMVGFVKDDGTGRLVKLARARGDLDPPAVATMGNAALAAMLEPHASGRSIKVARVDGDAVTWGPEIEEGSDESLAMDLAVSADHALVAWDTVSRDLSHSEVVIEAIDAKTMKPDGTAHVVSLAASDASVPRVAAREGGFWLAYLVHGETRAPAKKKDDKKKTVVKSPEKKAIDDEVDEEGAGEAVAASYIEVMPLDTSGAVVGAPRAVTSKDSTVLGFDIEPTDSGGLLVAWREDEAPTGSVGGRLFSVFVGTSGIAEPRLLGEEGLGVGAPELLPGFVSIGDVSGATKVGAIDGQGALIGPLGADAILGNGEPLASARGKLLIAQPAGKAMRLRLLKCDADVPDAG